MKINDLEAHLKQIILDNWEQIESLEIVNFNDNNIFCVLSVSDCENEFWCKKDRICEELFIKSKSFSLSLEDFFGEQWGIRLIKKAERIIIK